MRTFISGGKHFKRDLPQQCQEKKLHPRRNFMCQLQKKKKKIKKNNLKYD